MVAILLDADQMFAHLPGDEGDAWTRAHIGVLSGVGGGESEGEELGGRHTRRNGNMTHWLSSHPRVCMWVGNLAT